MKIAKLTIISAIIALVLCLAMSLSAQTSGRKTVVKKKSVSTKTTDVNADPDYRSRKLQGDEGKQRRPQKDEIKSSRKAEKGGDDAALTDDKPIETKLTRAGSFNGDLRNVRYKKPVLFERPERQAPDENEVIIGDPVPEGSARPEAPLAAPVPTASYLGLDFATFGSGRPPDTVGDVGPTHYIEGVNSSIGIYRKSDGVRLVGLTLNSFMSQGGFGNLCDTNNFGDPVILYDSFEDRWVITDFAFTLDGLGNVTSNSFQCFAVSKTGDPVAGGWNFYFTVDTDFLGDYPKFGIWPDGIYWSASMFQKPANGTFQNVRVRAMNKAQMYAGAPSVQVVTFNAPPAEFTILPANARLQTGTPPTGSPNYFAVVWQFTNAVSIYKFAVNWNAISTSTFTGPSISIAPASWSNAPGNVPASGGNNNDTLAPRLMMQNQYTNIGGVESLWNSHTVLGAAAGFAAPRFYQVNVTGGTVSATTTQAATHAPDATVNRYMPSLALDKDGNMLMGYSASSSTLIPALRWAGRLSTDPVNTLAQTETSFIEGTGAQNTSNRWGDYSAMSIAPDGCTFWYVGEYYITTGGNWQTRIGSTAYPSCVPLTNGTIQGTVTSSVTGLPINGAAVALGSRTTTTNASGFYSFAGISPGTYPTDMASATGYNSSTITNVVLANGGTTTQNFALGTPAASACLTDTAQADFQTGVPTNTDLTTVAGDVTLTNTPNIDQQNTTLGTNGNGINTTSWSGQTFTPAVTGQLVRADVNLFCASCSGTAPTITVSVRATSGGLPTGADLASVTFSTSLSGASGYFTANFSSPPTLNAGTQYALVIRNATNPTAGTNAVTRSGTSTLGADVYAGGSRVTSANSGSTWAIPLVPAAGGVTTDIGFRAYMQVGYSASGNLVSGLKDSNPAAGGSTTWTTISWNASTPANTSLQFQVAASNNVFGPFNFVGPDNTAATFFTTSGASLSQFNGNRYLRYKAYLATTNSAATPTLNDATICYTTPRVWTGAVSTDWNNPANWSSSSVPGTTDAAIIPTAGVTNNPTNTTSVAVASLQLGAGRIVDTGANTLTVNTCSPGAITGGSTTSYVKGSLTRCVDSTGTYNFPVGTTGGYAPVSLGGIIGSGNFNVNPSDGFLTGMDTTQSINRFWALTQITGSIQTNLTLNYQQADVPGGANEANFRFIRRIGTGNAEFLPTSSDTVGNSFTLNTVAVFSSWTLGRALAPTAANVSVAGRVVTANGYGVRNARVTLTGQNGAILTAISNSFGYYRFDRVASGETYVLNATARRYSFNPRTISVNDQMTDVDLVALP